jgi:hypothetical protein
MDANDIIRYAMRKAVIWVDDKKSETTPEYVLKNTLAIVENVEIAKQICEELQLRERKRDGRATTRYVISGEGADHWCYEDRSYEEVAASIKDMPVDEETKIDMLEKLRQMRDS